MFKIGDTIRLTRNVDSLSKGSEGIILGPYTGGTAYEWAIRITKRAGRYDTTGHDCHGTLKTRDGYFIPRGSYDSIEIPYDPKQQPDQEDDI